MKLSTEKKIEFLENLGLGVNTLSEARMKKNLIVELARHPGINPKIILDVLKKINNERNIFHNRLHTKFCS